MPSELEFATWLHEYGYRVSDRYQSLVANGYKCPASRVLTHCPCDRVHAMINMRGICDGGVVYGCRRRLK